MNVLAIAAHPDDETLGCGGTLLKHKSGHDEVFWIVASVSHEPQWPRTLIEAKAVEVEHVAQAYGIRNVFRLGFPTTQLADVPRADLMDALRDAIAQIRPQVVYLVNEGDIHSDHAAVAGATMAVLRPSAMSTFGVTRVLAYETLSSTDAAPPSAGRLFAPTVFNDISGYVDRKIEIMSMYATEMQEGFAPRGVSAIRSLARLRGATIGVEYAEAFALLRELM